jgi:tRNA1Val (adenine37-N6)-methyltransferase
MKVGTDAVLLGAWVAGDAATSVLDIGTGCGLIALQLAQRFESARIDAIDIDEPSIQEARLNFAASPWSTRLYAELSSLQTWQHPAYDLIVSNPPYYPNSFPIQAENRAKARTQATLNFKSLLFHAKRLLLPTGRLALVLPANVMPSFEVHMQTAELYCHRRTDICSYEGKNTVLHLLEIGFGEKTYKSDKLCIRAADGSYHADYLSLTKDFYLFS